MRNEVLHDNNSMGLMKALHFLSQGRPAPKPKYRYEPAGSAVHASRCLTKSERAVVNSLVAELASLDPTAASDSDRIRQLIGELSKQPVKFVPIKRQFPI